MSAPAYILETNRLRLRELTFDDSDFIIELLNTPGWLEFIGDKNVKSKDQAIDYLQKGPLKSYQENGFGLCLVERKVDGAPIGTCGILKRDTLDQPDLGFAFLPEGHGQGYAFEIAKATTEFGFLKLNLSEILAITKPENHRSINLLVKLGFRFMKPISFGNSPDILSLYSRQG